MKPVSETTLLRSDFRAAARLAAARLMVLLKNDGVLPLTKWPRTIAVIGPLADDRVEMMGNWAGDGRDGDVVTVLAGIKAAVPAATSRRARGWRDPSTSRILMTAQGFSAKPTNAPESSRPWRPRAARTRSAHVLGQTGAMSGEAASRASLDLPGRQRELAEAVMALARPTAVILMNGRPLAIPWLADCPAAVVEAWIPAPRPGMPSLT